MGATLFHVGIAVMVLAAIGAVVCIPVFIVWKRKLRGTFDQEYGKEH